MGAENRHRRTRTGEEPKHAKPRDRRKLTRASIAGGAIVSAPLSMIALSSEVHAASSTVWDRLADCESSGNFHINTGNGYYGGFQFDLATWREAGGTGNPADATPAEQLKRAKIILASPVGGPGRWSCAGEAGLTRSLGAAEGLSILGGNAVAPSMVAKAPVSTATGKAAQAVAYARAHISSAPYLLGGNGPVRFDCSGLTSQAWLSAGVGIPRTSQTQLAGLPHVSLSAIRPGDLVIYSFGGEYAGHVAMYVGRIGPNGEDLIDTATRHPGGGVGWSSMSSRGGSVAGVVRPAPYTGAPTTPSVPPSHGPAPKPVGGTHSYTVRSGDTLSGIAHTELGAADKWPDIFRANDLRSGDPDLIYPGETLRLP